MLKMLRFFNRRLICFYGRASLAQGICNFTLNSLIHCHISRGIANGTDASLPLSDLNKSDRTTVSFLTSSCGLSPESALSVAKRFRLRSVENPDSVLRLLKACGVSDAYITAIITKSPRVLKIHADRTLKPKLEFLCGAGLHGDAVADILATNASLLHYSLEKLVWCFDFFSATLQSKSDVIQALKSTRNCLDSSCQAQYEILQEHGVSNDAIIHLLKFHPTSLIRKERLLDAIKTVKEMGFSPTCQNFARAVSVIVSATKDGWLRRIQLLREMGWSDKEVFTMFRMMPNTFALSDDNIRARVKFFQEKIGWGPAFLSKRPNLLTMNLEKRTMPRFLVLNQLMSMDLIPQKWYKYCFVISSQEFSKRFIDKYKDKAPAIVEYYRGNTEVQVQN